MVSKSRFTQQKALSALFTCVLVRALIQPVGNLGSNPSSAVGRLENVSLFDFVGKKKPNCQTVVYFEIEKFSVFSVSSVSFYMSYLNVLQVRTEIAI